MTPVEWIATILIVFSAVKVVVLLIKPVAWMNFAKGVWAKPGVVRLVGVVLGAVVLYYLLMELTIVQILATATFVVLLIMIGLSEEVPYLIKKYDALVKKGGLWKQYWLYTLIWIVLLVWGAKELWM